MELVELLVRMDCQGCEQKVRKQLAKLKGVDSVEIDLRTNKVTVYGFVERRKVLKAVRKTGKRAEFWQEAFTGLHPFPHHNMGEATTTNYNLPSSQYSHNYTSYNNSSSSFGSHVFQIQPFKRTYNYKKHGYNNYDHSTDESIAYYHQQGSTSFAAPSMFSDEDPNSCSIM